MRIASLSIALATLWCALPPVSGCGRVPLEPDNIILRSDIADTRYFVARNYPYRLVSVDGKCRLTLQLDGNLVLERKRNIDGEWQTRWESGGAGEYIYWAWAELNDKGKFGIYANRGDWHQLIYTTNNADPPEEAADYYVFGIGSYTNEEYGDWRHKCDLRIQSFTDGVCQEEWVNSCDNIQENVIMRSDDPDGRRFYAGEDNAHVAKNGKCRLRLGGDGNLLLEGRENIQTEAWMTYWETGGRDDTEGTYVAALTKQGDLRVINEKAGEDAKVVFSTNTGGVSTYESLYHELSIVTSRKKEEVPCRLKLWNSPNEENYDRCSERWTNVKYDFHSQPYWGSFDHSLYTFDVLQKGEMFVKGSFYSWCGISDDYPICENSEVCPYVTLYLQPNCELVMFDGATLADKGEIIWSADIDGDLPEDCYLLADENDGSLKLFDGKYNKNKEDEGNDVGNVIWSMYQNEERRQQVVHVRMCASGPFP